jgi:outer membrane lipoprotein-sorting protein
MIGNVGQSEYYTDDTVKIMSNSSGNTYAYASGNATGAYASLISDYKRELLHIYPDIVFVADRIYPTNNASNRRILYQVHNIPTLSGGIINSSNGTGKVAIKMAVPSLPTPLVVSLATINSDFNSYRVEYTSTSENLFITAMALENTTANKTYTITAISGTGCAGVSLTDATSRWNAIFVNTYSPAATYTISFISPLSGATQYYYISNLQPSQAHYYKQLDNRDGTFTTTISNSAGAVSGYTGNFTTDSAGVGNFRNRILIPAPPTRLNISGLGFLLGDNGIETVNES